MSGGDHNQADERIRVARWLDNREARGHRADVIGLVRTDGDPITLRASDLRALCGDVSS